MQTKYLLALAAAGSFCATPPTARAQAAAPTYAETFRPQVHFSPAKNWTNDPNGLVYFDGEYHLFFQYNPVGDEWGHMSWGHAVSRDLLHWKELPVALPEHSGEMIFTGSVVIDAHNTSGLCLPNTPCMVAIYTSHRGHDRTQRQSQSLAFSHDHGRTWHFYPGNPVLDLNMSDFRDPSVTWNEQTHRWLMAVALPNEHKVAFYASPDLKSWTRLSTFGPAGDTAGQWECPDLLQVPTQNGGDSVWALKVGINPGAPQGGSGEQYFLGAFDGTSFHTLPGSEAPHWTDYGKDSYCAISFNHLPTHERPTLLGWMNNWQYAAKLPTSPWRGQMTLPRRLTAVRDSAGLTLSQQPVIAPLRTGAAHPIRATLPPSKDRTQIASATTPFELELTFTPSDTQTFGLRLFSDAGHFTDIGFDRARNRLFVDRTHSGLALSKDFPARTEAPASPTRPWNLHVIADRSSIEVFAQDGTLAMTNLVFPPSTAARIELYRQAGRAPLRVTGRTWQLQSVWTSPPSAANARQSSER